MKSLLWVGLPVLGALLFGGALPLVAGGGDGAVLGQPSTPAAAGANAMAVDAIPGGDIDATRMVEGSGPFDVDIVVTEARTPYSFYEYWLKWDASVLVLDKQAELAPAGLVNCGGPMAEPRPGRTSG